MAVVPFEGINKDGDPQNEKLYELTSEYGEIILPSLFSNFYIRGWFKILYISILFMKINFFI